MFSEWFSGETPQKEGGGGGNVGRVLRAAQETTRQGGGRATKIKGTAGKSFRKC